MERRDGSAFEYISDSTIASLPRSMPVGTIIRKRRWELGFARNGRKVGFNMLPVLVPIVIGTILFINGARLILKSYSPNVW
jgi:hypothetical protein